MEFLGRGMGSDQWMEDREEIPSKRMNPEEILAETLRKEGFCLFPLNISPGFSFGVSLDWPAKSEKVEMERLIRVVEKVAAQNNRTPLLSGPHMWTGGVFVALCGFKVSVSS